MERQEQIRGLNRLLLAELPEYRSQAGTFSPGSAASGGFCAPL